MIISPISEVLTCVRDNGMTCPVCLESIEESRWITVCGHAFHHACLRHWLRTHTSCPMCREEVKLPRESGDAVEFVIEDGDDMTILTPIVTIYEGVIDETEEMNEVGELSEFDSGSEADDSGDSDYEMSDYGSESDY